MKINKIILLTNDDGYESKGILELREALSHIFERVIVVAPAFEKSACSHSVTLHEPLKLIEVSQDFYKLSDGTPSDCIYIAKSTIFKNFLPDIVISGINRGANMGEDITYSGTVAGAIEATLQGIPSIAISQVFDDKNQLNYNLAISFIIKLVINILNQEFPLLKREIFNINVPANGNIDKFEITYAGHRLYGNDTHIYYSPRGEILYWLGLHPLQWATREIDEQFRGYRSDFDAIADNFISITPIKIDMTAYERIKKLDHWFKNNK